MSDKSPRELVQSIVETAVLLQVPGKVVSYRDINKDDDPEEDDFILNVNGRAIQIKILDLGSVKDIKKKI